MGGDKQGKFRLMNRSPFTVLTLAFIFFEWLAHGALAQTSPPEAPSTNAPANMRPAETANTKLVLIKGQVTDGAGAGLSGVQVVLRHHSAADHAGEILSETTTDDLGDFALRGSEKISGSVDVIMTKDQFAPLVRELELSEATAPPFLGESMEGSLVLSGRVVDARNDQPIVHATVEITAAYRDWNVETDDEGRFSATGLPPGAAEITVDASGFGRQKQMIKSVAGAEAIQLALKPERVVRLTVVNEAGEPLAGVEVELVAPKQDDLRNAVTDEAGLAVFSGLSSDAESVLARLTYAGFLSSDSFDRSIPLSQDTVESKHQLTMLRAATIAGVVRDGEGRPVNGARVMTGKGHSLRSGRAWTDDAGRFTLTDLAAGPVVLTVHRSDFAPELHIVEAKRGETVAADFSLKPGRTIRGTVKDERGTPMPASPVVTRAWRGFSTLGLRAMTDPEGRFELAGAPRDEFELSAHAPPTSPVLRLVKPDEEIVDIVVPYVPEFDKHVGGTYIKIGDAAPWVTLRTIDQKVIELNQQQGKTVLLIFWVSWCGACQSELPRLVMLYEKYQSRPNFVMIGINHDKEEADFRQFMEKHKLPWPQVHGHENGAILAGKEFGAFVYPTGFILGPDGKVAGAFLVGKQIEEKLNEVLNKPQRVRIEPQRDK